MGLDFSHGDAHWAYSGFNRFRTRLAEAIGIKLMDMQGFGGTIPWETVTDAIVPLLNHSDCDGELSPEECATVAPRLRELVAEWSDMDSDKREALPLAEAMEQCAGLGEPLEFR